MTAGNSSNDPEQLTLNTQNVTKNTDARDNQDSVNITSVSDLQKLNDPQPIPSENENA